MPFEPPKSLVYYVSVDKLKTPRLQHSTVASYIGGGTVADSATLVMLGGGSSSGQNTQAFDSIQSPTTAGEYQEMPRIYLRSPRGLTVFIKPTCCLCMLLTAWTLLLL